jgi:hypothetical protein
VKNYSPDDSQNFLNTFWLGDIAYSSFKNDYLTATNYDAANALDALLISEKFSRFDWDNLLKNPVPKLKHFPDNFLTWHGMVFHNKKAVANKKIGMVIQMPDSSKIFVPVNTDAAGNFTIKNIDFRDSAKVFFRLNNINKDDKDIDVSFTKIDESTPFTGTFPNSLFIVQNRKPNDTVPQRIKDYDSELNNFENDDRYKTLQGVVVKAKPKNLTEQLNKTLSSPQFRDPGEIVFDFTNENSDDASGGIIDWLNGKVPGLTVEGGIAYMRNQPVKIYINEFGADYEQLNSYPVTEIAMVKVLRTPFMLGSGAPVVVVYTKTASMFKPETVSIKSSKIVGYPNVDKFKIVDYSDAKFNTGDHDTRSVLYWNTHLRPEKNKQTITFYNNDISKNFHIIIIGFNKNGPVYLDKEISF